MDVCTRNMMQKNGCPLSHGGGQNKKKKEEQEQEQRQGQDEEEEMKFNTTSSDFFRLLLRNNGYCEYTLVYVRRASRSSIVL